MRVLLILSLLTASSCTALRNLETLSADAKAAIATIKDVAADIDAARAQADTDGSGAIDTPGEVAGLSGAVLSIIALMVSRYINGRRRENTEKLFEGLRETRDELAVLRYQRPAAPMSPAAPVIAAGHSAPHVARGRSQKKA